MSDLGRASAVAEGDELWRPSRAFVESSHLSQFRRWLAANRQLEFGDYEELWRWSTDDIEAFWSSLWDFFDVQSTTPFSSAVSGEGMLRCKWFEGSAVNYAEHVLRYEAEAPRGKPALLYANERQSLKAMDWTELGQKVRAIATRLREMGIQPGDRVVSYMPNLPETIIAMLGATAIGAIWAAAAPEFGSRTVLDRFQQIEPKLAFVADGYLFAGKEIDRTAEISAIVDGLPSLRHVIWLPYLGRGAPENSAVNVTPFEDLLTADAPGRSDFRFERVPFDHPLWILFSSGTTGKPKAIAHSHVGIVVEHLKYKFLHSNLMPDDCMFFYTTTGWMIWNSMVSTLMTGASAVFYDGSPTFGGVDCLWRIAEAAKVTHFGASPTLVQQMKAAGLKPKEKFNLDRLQSISLSGAPSGPEAFAWFYSDVKSDISVASQSGGTELCSGLVGAVPERPIYAGEMQGRLLGMDVHAWNEDGVSVIDQVGELVVTKPFPSMPLYFWGDVDNERYKETYFSVWPEVWRHGDLLKINERGGCFIYGRSDATLNRHGVRIGTAEIYSIVGQIKGVTDSLVVCCELPGGGFYMPLFVAMEPGVELDDRVMSEIRSALREQASPRHVPDRILQAPGIPYTLTGKKMEIPVRRILLGEDPARVASADAMANPDVLDWYASAAADAELVRLRRTRAAGA